LADQKSAIFMLRVSQIVPSIFNDLQPVPAAPRDMNATWKHTKMPGDIGQTGRPLAR
jgi:hypothetical protein